MKNFYFAFLLLINMFFSFAQKGNSVLLHEVGIISGPVSMQTDFGERHHFPSSVLNIGYGVGLVYYISYNPNRIYWNDRTTYLKNHSKLRLEASYMSDNLIQRGRYIESNSYQALLLKGIVSKAKLYNFGFQYQFSLFSATADKNLQPYFSMGGTFTIYKPEVKSLLGDIEQDATLIPSAYQNSIFNDVGNTPSITLGTGTTYFINDNVKLLADLRWQRFVKDDVEGLTPKISANKYNDWLFFLNFGIVFSLN